MGAIIEGLRSGGYNWGGLKTGGYYWGGLEVGVITVGA